MALLGSTFLAPSVSSVGNVPGAIQAAATSASPLPPAAPVVLASQAKQQEPASLGGGAFDAAAIMALGAAAVGASGSMLTKRRRGGRRAAAARTARQFFGGASSPSTAPVPARPLAIPVLPEPDYRQLGDELLAEMDAGFDPLNLATQPSPWGKTEDAYYNYREAEVKHGRLAMLATVGWLSSEELQGALARRLGLPDDLAPGELAPSLVNGGLGSLPNWFLPTVFMVSAWIELVPKMQGNRADLLKYKPQKGRVPGDLGFDPLALRGTLEATGYSISRLHNAEVKHGRAAMIAIVAFVVQEFITKVDVLTEDEISADRIVSAFDKGIDIVDKVTGAPIPDIPVPFPGI